MARKSSDMILLLGSRGRASKRNSGFGGKLRAKFQGLLGFGGRSASGRGQSWVSGGRRSGAASLLEMVPGWLAVMLALACFVGGYFVGGHFAVSRGGDPQGSGLNANGGDDLSGRTPGMIGEVDAKVLSNTAFALSMYNYKEPAAAKQAAKSLSDRLRSLGLAMARPYEYPAADGPVWIVVVYYDGPDQRARTLAQILALPDDAADEAMRYCKTSEQVWPIPLTIR